METVAPSDNTMLAHSRLTVGCGSLSPISFPCFSQHDEGVTVIWFLFLPSACGASPSGNSVGGGKITRKTTLARPPPGPPTLPTYYQRVTCERNVPKDLLLSVLRPILMCGERGSPHLQPSNSQTPAECQGIQLNSDTTYLEIESDPTG